MIPARAAPRSGSGSGSGSGPGSGSRPASGTGQDAAFRAAVAGLEAGVRTQRLRRPEITFGEEPPPRKLAPCAAAIAATVHDAADAEGEIGWGRFVLLYDPAGQPGWAGQFRIIAYVRADLEPEIAADPLIGQIGWSWLTEALEVAAAEYRQISGTVTHVVTEGFGTKQGEPVATSFELRASWSPAAAARMTPDPTRPGRVPPAKTRSGPAPPYPSQPDLAGHVAAWCDTLCMAAGLPPLAPGVRALRPPRRRQS